MTCLLAVMYRKIYIGFDWARMLNHTLEGIGDHGEGPQYADPLVIREYLAGSVELAICGGGGYMDIASVSMTLVPKVPTWIACKISKQTVNDVFCYIYPCLESCDPVDVCCRHWP